MIRVHAPLLAALLSTAPSGAADIECGGQIRPRLEFRDPAAGR